MAQSYFHRFPQFKQDRNLSLHEEFGRLALSQNWTDRSNRYVKERNKFLRAQFDEYVGVIERKGTLEDWQALCQELGSDPLPNSKTQCRLVVFTSSADLSYTLADHAE